MQSGRMQMHARGSRIWQSVLVERDVLNQQFEADSTKVRLLLVAALHTWCRPKLTLDVLSKHLSLLKASYGQMQAVQAMPGAPVQTVSAVASEQASQAWR